jgi:hypothetical protein
MNSIPTDIKICGRQPQMGEIPPPPPPDPRQLFLIHCEVCHSFNYEAKCGRAKAGERGIVSLTVPLITKSGVTLSAEHKVACNFRHVTYSISHRGPY